MKIIVVFFSFDAILRIRVCIRHPVRFGHLFLGKSCKLNWPLPQRKSAVIFREYFALNPY